MAAIAKKTKSYPSHLTESSYRRNFIIAALRLPLNLTATAATQPVDKQTAGLSQTSQIHIRARRLQVLVIVEC
jgi:arginine/lysine/ornithine decarboxylase